MKTWPAIAKQLLAAAILAMAALPASSWARLYCYFANGWADPATKTMEVDGAVHEIWMPYTGLADQMPGVAVAIVWLIGIAAYIWWVRRSIAGLLFTALPLAAFAYFSRSALMYAYPVCNAF